MKFLVIGDVGYDIFQYGVCERLSPEAPVPIFNPTVVKKTLGMAGNVANNIKALGVECEILGRDRPKKIRYVDEVSNQILLRVDKNDSNYRIDKKI